MNIEEIQHICKALPSVTEDIKWGNDLVFSIGGKMFCVVGLDQPPTASFKVPDEDFDEMCDRQGFKPAPYMARHKWVWINNIAGMSKAEWKKYLRQSYSIVANKLPAKIKKELGIK